MTRRMFLFGLAAWVGLLALGGWWAAGPWHWSEQNPGATVEAAARQFPFHVAGRPNSSLRTHGERIDEENLELPPDFEPRDWGWRESRNRAALFCALWTVGGFFLRWFLGRVLRGLKDYGN